MFTSFCSIPARRRSRGCPRGILRRPADTIRRRRTDLAPSKLDNSRSMPKCIFLNEPFDWQGDQPPRHPWSKTVIYETHVRGFTMHPTSGVDHPGTYRGLIEKIPYLTALGVTAVELMPVQEFNDTPLARTNPHTGQPLSNYWGYDPVVFRAPKASYSSAGGVGQQKLEFKEMVRACHKAGIEVILDVVFNHTAEGDERGPTLCFRGIDNAIFYTLADDKRYYKDYTGTGNTVNANHPVVRDHILAALRYWMVEMHVDGFRFDLASVLGRDRYRQVAGQCPAARTHRRGPDLERHQDRRRGVGHRRRVPGRKFFRAPLGGVERPVPR